MLKVIIADDDVNVCNGLKTLINWSNYDAQVTGVANNGQEALNFAFETPPDLIISDIKMPVMNGLELCEKISKIKSDISIIILSAYEDFSFAQTAIKYGVNDYILKPIDAKKLEQLNHIIKDISDKVRNQQELSNQLHSPVMRERLFTYLKNADSDACRIFFENEFSDENSSDIVKEWCLKLIDIIFDFLDYIGVEDSACIASKNKTIQDLISIKFKSDMKKYVMNLFMNVLQFSSSKKDKRIEQVVEYIKSDIMTNYSDPDLTLNSLAQKHGFTHNYISTIFHQTTGDNINSYISKYRIRQALALLQNPSVSINEISGMVGFSDPHYFTRVFKKSEGITPSEYRSMRFTIKGKVMDNAE